MKHNKLVLFTILLSVGITFGQMQNQWVLTDFNIVTMLANNGEKYQVNEYRTTKEFTPAMLNPDDKHKLNQGIIWLPTQVTKKIKLEYNQNITYDKEVTFEYLKPRNVDLEFNLTKDGILVTTNDFQTTVAVVKDKNEILHAVVENRIHKEGYFSVILSDGNQINLKVINYTK